MNARSTRSIALSDLEDSANVANSLFDSNRLSEGAADGVFVLGAFCNEEHGVPARDLTIAALCAYASMTGAEPHSLTCVDALAGCGLRALRVALEVYDLAGKSR
jgi:hypothetical protein